MPNGQNDTATSTGQIGKTEPDLNSTSAFSIGRVVKTMEITQSGMTFWETVAFSGFMIGTLMIVVYSRAWAAGGAGRFGVLFALACGAWMAGSLLGFLFGVPRFKTDASNKPPLDQSAAARTASDFTPSTNLEQISDWLTKIIVGATLVQLGTLAEKFSSFCVAIGRYMRDDTASVFAGGIMVMFFFAAFMWGYLWCSIRIFREMVRLTAGLQENSQ